MELPLDEDVLRKSVQTLREMTKTQCSDGSWNYDQFNHGMANGLILALAIMDNKAPPTYMKTPDVWLCDEEN